MKLRAVPKTLLSKASSKTIFTYIFNVDGSSQQRAIIFIIQSLDQICKYLNKYRVDYQVVCVNVFMVFPITEIRADDRSSMINIWEAQVPLCRCHIYNIPKNSLQTTQNKEWLNCRTRKVPHSWEWSVEEEKSVGSGCRCWVLWEKSRVGFLNLWRNRRGSLYFYLQIEVRSLYLYWSVFVYPVNTT